MKKDRLTKILDTSNSVKDLALEFGVTVQAIYIARWKNKVYLNKSSKDRDRIISKKESTKKEKLIEKYNEKLRGVFYENSTRI